MNENRKKLEWKKKVWAVEISDDEILKRYNLDIQFTPR